MRKGVGIDGPGDDNRHRTGRARGAQGQRAIFLIAGSEMLDAHIARLRYASRPAACGGSKVRAGRCDNVASIGADHEQVGRAGCIEYRLQPLRKPDVDRAIRPSLDQRCQFFGAAKQFLPPQRVGCLIAFMEQRDNADSGRDKKHDGEPKRQLRLQRSRPTHHDASSVRR